MSKAAPAYPAARSARDRWVLDRRPSRHAVDPWRPVAALIEQEPDEHGGVVDAVAVMLTASECPRRCVMCDLWKHTLPGPTPQGAIPAQIDAALAQLQIDPARSRAAAIKLYNSGSFFDPCSVPPGDHEAIAERVRRFARVIVECHPALVGPDVLAFRDRLATKLEVAMGLEVARPQTLAKLNKRLTPDGFRRAARFLSERDIDVRAFVLVQPPFVAPRESVKVARESVEFAFDSGASIAVLIPTRAGNGALEALAEQGCFVPARLATLEYALETCLALHRGRVIADLWSLEHCDGCTVCEQARGNRLRAMNLNQSVPPPIACAVCAGREG